MLSERLGLKTGEEGFVLEPGDAAHSDAENPHRLVVFGGRGTRISSSSPAPYLLLRSYL